MFQFLSDFINQRFIIGDIPINAEIGSYVPSLVIMSFIIAMAGSFSALRLATQIDRAETQKSAHAKQIIAALVFGAGIWSMHFIGMLAYDMDMIHTYDAMLTFVSMAVAILVAYGVLQIIRTRHVNITKILIGGTLLGTGICAMHYIGMAAMQMDAELKFLPTLFTLSVIIAFTASIAALWIVFKLKNYNGHNKIWWQILAAAIMGAAICGMHYTGMAASVFIPFANCRYDPNQSYYGLALTVGIISSSIFSIAMLVSAENVTKPLGSSNTIGLTGNKVFFHLAAILGIFLVIIITSYLFFSQNIIHRKQNEEMMNAAGLGRALLSRYNANASLSIISKSKNQTISQAKYMDNIDSLEKHIEQNYNAFIYGGEIFLNLARTDGFYFSGFKDDNVTNAFLQAHAKWNDFNQTFVKNYTALESIDGTNFESLHKKYLKELDTKFLSAFEAQQNAINTLSSHLKDESEKLTFQKRIILVIGLMTYFLAMAYARFFIAENITKTENELYNIQGHLKEKIEEQTKDLNQQKTFLDTLIANLPIALFAKDVKNDYRYVAFNKEAEEMFGISASQIIGTTDYEHFTKEEADLSLKTDRQVIRQRKLVKIDREPISTKAKGTFIAQTFKMPIYDGEGKPLILLGLMQDVTKEIQQQEELENAIIEAKKANEAKSDFLANMSHEIRTPMNAVLGMSDLLKDTNLEQEQKEYVTGISAAGETLLNIINDIIDISKIKSGKFSLEEVEFNISNYYKILQIFTCTRYAKKILNCC